MFKYWSIKKYGVKLLPYLEKYYGENTFYTRSQIRTIVYKKNFNPDYLPLGYLLFINPSDVKKVISLEFPHINIAHYKHEILSYLDKKSYQGYLKILQHATP